MPSQLHNAVDIQGGILHQHTPAWASIPKMDSQPYRAAGISPQNKQSEHLSTELKIPTRQKKSCKFCTNDRHLARSRKQNGAAHAHRSLQERCTSHSCQLEVVSQRRRPGCERILDLFFSDGRWWRYTENNNQRWSKVALQTLHGQSSTKRTTLDNCTFNSEQNVMAWPSSKDRLFFLHRHAGGRNAQEAQLANDGWSGSRCGW